MDKPKNCPMMSIGQFTPAPCCGAECAWWDRLMGMCFIATGADSVKGVETQLNALNMIVETIGANANDAPGGGGGRSVDHDPINKAFSNDSG